MFGTMLILLTLSMSWEHWMIPIIVMGNSIVWFLHIGRAGTEGFYETLCAGLLLVGFFFYGVHSAVLFDIPAVACMILLVFSMFDKKRLLYMTIGLYLLELLYHFFLLHTVTSGMGIQDIVRLVFGAGVVAGSMAIALYRINKRRDDRALQDSILAQLETAGRQNAEFLSNVSHELRTPTNMVLGISEVVLEKDISPGVREDMRSIQLAGKRLSSHINNMLDYTEIVEGTLTPSNEPYMIASVLNDVITMAAMQKNRQQLEMVFDMDPKMPAVLVGDAEKLSHVLKILLENSIKFTEEGGINVCIGFRPESYGINLLIDIQDTGIGMDAAQITQMCDDFYQADSGSRRFAGGLGLGLPIARGLLHAMGGFIHFDSKGQEGLQVHIAIPQTVSDYTPTMLIHDVERLCIACYFRPEKYSCDEVRRYYDNMILHMVEGLGIEGYQAHNFNGLLKLQSSHAVTHVFIAQAEYEENSAYYEELSNKLRVVIIAEKDFLLDAGSRLLVIRKPFSALSVVNLLNGEVKENGFEEAQAAGRRPFSCVGVRALAVDDEEMNLVVAKGVLGSYGIQVDTCPSGKEAIKRCTAIDYDIVFLDHMMPGFDGVETLKKIREIEGGIYQDLPVIALTANTLSGAREMFRNEGFTEFIPKPIERAVLERVLRKVLPKSSIQYGAAPTRQDDGQTDTGIPESPGLSSPEASAPQDVTPEEISAPDEPLSPFDALVRAGINVQMGLDYCAGEEDFYLEMLQMFCEQSGEKKSEIASYYEAASWADYAIKVHALKSTSLTIGAEQLSEQAKLLEQAGKKEDVDYIRQNHSPLLDLYDQVCESIAGLLERQEESPGVEKMV
jgi:signal transduction histidine kinase/DNA-binding NarL/FixJ family response regulator